ncbi:MAG: hypothetical protein WC045_02050 [Patescibacteria group bacterium]
MAQTNSEKILLAWQTEGFQTRSFNTTNIALVFIILVAVIGYAIYTTQWLMALVFALLPLALYSYLTTDKKPVNIGVTASGVMVDGRFHSFDQYNGYWIGQGNHTLYLVPKSKIATQIAIPLGTQDAQQVTRLFPVDILLVEGKVTDFSESLANWLRK